MVIQLSGYISHWPHSLGHMYTIVEFALYWYANPGKLLAGNTTHLLTWWGLDNIDHDDVIKWKLFSYYWPFVWGIHRSPVNSPHKGDWRGALKFPLICAWINDGVNNGEAGDFRRYRAHCGVTVVILQTFWIRFMGKCFLFCRCY